jgi:hypothetical protein
MFELGKYYQIKSPSGYTNEIGIFRGYHYTQTMQNNPQFTLMNAHYKVDQNIPPDWSFTLLSDKEIEDWKINNL